MQEIAQKYYRGNSTAASDKLLGDFRRGFMGYCSLEVPGFLEHLKAIKQVDRDLKIVAKKAEISQQLKVNRDDYFSKYDIGKKVFKDNVGDVIERKDKKLVSLDRNNGNYEGW